MIKKSLMFFVFVVLFLGFISAQSLSIKFPLGNTFKAGENITLKVSLFDANNNPTNGKIKLILEDSEKIKKIEKTVSSREIAEINLGRNALHGFWTVTAKYNNLKTSKIFTVEAQELAKFEIKNDMLTITNIGNIKYGKTVQIVIGNTIGIKKPELDVGKSITFRLIAPKGEYNIRVSDGKTSIQRGNIALTGNAIGILDERIVGGNIITGGIKPKNDVSMSYLKKSKLIYVFILVVFGATILLAIERSYRRKANR